MPRPLRTVPVLFLLLACAAALADDMPASFSTAVSRLDAVPVAVMAPVDNGVLEAVYADVPRLKAGPDAARPDGAWRFAEPLDAYFDLGQAGAWEALADGSRLWRLRLASPGATSLNLGLSRFDVPAGARLWLYDAGGDVVQGPYTAADRTAEGGLWTALVPADEIVVELHVPAGAGDADLAIHRVNHGFRGFTGRDGAGPAVKQGQCQNDVVCPEADPWRRQVRAVAWYTLEGWGTCTGSLVNNAAADGRPFFLSAEHCGVTAGNASTMVVYWNFESPRCGRLAGGSLADNQSGATFRASYRPSDFVLVELRQKPKAAFDVYYAGWNAANTAPARAVGVHHPNLDEKAISFSNGRLRPDGPTHWEIVWNDGTTEPGSSGSCIFDPEGYCVGTLTGGDSFCRDPRAPDYYGRFSVHWTGGGTARTSLRPWLDPTGSGRRKMGGLDLAGGGGGGGGGGATCAANAKTLCLGGGRFAATVTWQDFNGKSGDAMVAEKSASSGAFSFFAAQDWDLMVRVVDGCGANARYWVLAAAPTNLKVTLKVEDTKTGQVRTYRNPLGQIPGGVIDKNAFAGCPSDPVRP
jgi:hypothetical protein